MVYITGDCHGDFERFDIDNFAEQKEMIKNREKVHKIRPSVIYLMHGLAFMIGGKKIFTVGGDF